LIKTDSLFNNSIVKKLNSPVPPGVFGAAQGGFVSYVNGSVMISTVKASPISLTSLGAGFPFEAVEDQSIFACYTEQLEPLWYHKLPWIDFSNDIFPVKSRNGNYLIGGNSDEFNWMGFSHGVGPSPAVDVFLIEVDNQINNNILIEGSIYFDENENGLKENG
jgi:hypothetical protein